MAKRGASKSAEKKKEKFRKLHPEGRKAYSHKRRGHNCKWAQKADEIS